MDSATEDLYLQKLEEYIYDENKVVTFTWASNTLNISAHDVQNLLKMFVKNQRDTKPDELGVTYVLTGTSLENDGLKVLIVKEKELDEKRSLFKEISSEIVYSIQKSKQIDLNILSMVDALDVNQPRNKPLTGSIIDKNCVKRILKVIKTEPPPPVRQQPVQKPKPNIFANIPPKKTNTVDNKSNDNETKPVNGVKPVPHNTKQSTIKSKKSGIDTFFNKMVTKPKEKNITPVEQNKNEVAEVTSEENNTQQEIETINIVEEPVEQPKITNGKATNKKRPRKHKNNDEPSKRRKRIIEHNDSDSDDIFASDEGNETEDIINDSEEEIKPVVKIDLNAPKNKKRKLINQTYTDEDGFMLTQKEWVCVTDSEDEKEQKDPEIAEVKEKPKLKESKSFNNYENSQTSTGAKNKKLKKNSSNGSQTTLTNFFKRT